MQADGRSYEQQQPQGSQKGPIWAHGYLYLNTYLTLSLNSSCSTPGSGRGGVQAPEQFVIQRIVILAALQEQAHPLARSYGIAHARIKPP